MSAARLVAVVLPLALAACSSPPPPVAPPPSPAAAAAPPPTDSAPAASETPAPPSAPGPVVVARGLGAVDNLVATEAFVYVVKKRSILTRIPLGGGPAEDIATFEGQAVIESMAPSSDGLYVLTTAIGAEATKQGYAGQGSLFLVPAKGGDAQALGQGFRKPGSIVVDDTQVHFTALKDAGSKASWFLFSAPRKTGVPLTATALGESESKTARLVGEHAGAAVVGWDKGGIFVRSFTRGASGKPMKGLSTYAFSSRYTALAGDRLLVGGSATRDGKAQTVIGVASLAAPERDLATIALLDPASSVGGVAFAGDDVLYTLVGTREKHDKDGSIVRVSPADGKSTVLASDQFQPTEIIVTARGIMWLDKGSTDTDEPDGTLLLLPK